ncbi:MAG: heme ABC exporter ATP-binding protein CcmA [Pseudomonadota bacterium]
MTRALIVDQIALERGGQRVVAGVSFAVEAGEALLLRGPNGSGKTTLLRAVAGFLPVAAGRITLSPDDDTPIAERSHSLGHANAINRKLTVEENLAFWARYLGGDVDKVDPAIEAFALDDLRDIPTGMLSAGQARRAGLARLAVADRPLWLLDEPTTSLDTANAGLVADAVNAHISGGGIAVIATHLPLATAFTHELDLAALSGAHAA